LESQPQPLLLGHLSLQPLDKSRHVALLEGYARHAVVVHVEPRVSFRGDADSAFRRGLSQALDALDGRTDERVVRLILPSRLPLNRIERVAAWNRWLALRSFFRRVHRRRPGTQCVLTCSSPLLLPTLRGLGTDLTVYEARDDYVAQADTRSRAESLSRWQSRMLAQCDVAWAVSKTLAERLRNERADVLETTNGVKCTEFMTPVPSTIPDLERLPRPRIGLVGNLNDRVDWELLDTIARKRPDWHVVVVGPIYPHQTGLLTRNGVGKLKKNANVTMVPAVAADEIPAVVHAFDVGLIPYRISDATAAINPLKVYQYLAAGKPVVATMIPALAELKDVVECRGEPDEFIAAIARALESARDGKMITLRRERVLDFSWDRVADERVAVMRARLNGHSLR
jgi:glycosyltransferase involved in cell wall biosynthesis